MKDSTHEKLSNLAAWTCRIEPKWYLGWALGCALVGGLYGNMSFILIGIMYLFMAELARQRNEAATIGLEMAELAVQWQKQSEAWRGLSDAWQKAYYTEPRPQDKP